MASDPVINLAVRSPAHDDPAPLIDVANPEYIVERMKLLEQIAQAEDNLSMKLAVVGQRAYSVIRSCRITATQTRKQASYLREALVSSVGG